MTHDELLDKIYWHWKNAGDSEFHGLGGYRKALRAVVELHKSYAGSLNGFPTFRCTECGFAYPCPTIQVIEKELI